MTNFDFTVEKLRPKISLRKDLFRLMADTTLARSVSNVLSLMSKLVRHRILETQDSRTTAPDAFKSLLARSNSTSAATSLLARPSKSDLAVQFNSFLKPSGRTVLGCPDNFDGFGPNNTFSPRELWLALISALKGAYRKRYVKCSNHFNFQTYDAIFSFKGYREQGRNQNLRGKGVEEIYSKWGQGKVGRNYAKLGTFKKYYFFEFDI